MNTDHLYGKRFDPLKRALTGKFNIFMLFLTVIFVIDLSSGSPMMTKLIEIQYSIRGINVHGPDVKILSFFGTFNDVQKLGAVFDKYLAGLFFVFWALPVTLGTLTSLFKK